MGKVGKGRQGKGSKKNSRTRGVCKTAEPGGCAAPADEQGKAAAPSSLPASETPLLSPAPGMGVSSILGLLDYRLGSGFLFTPTPYPQTWSASSLLMSEHSFSSLTFLASHTE